MKKIGILVLLCFASIAQAQPEPNGEREFQEELKLPQAHYSPTLKKLVVEVIPDERNHENLKQQETIIETIHQDSRVPVEIIEVTEEK